MPTMRPYPISGSFPLPEKMFSETFRWITNHIVKDWVIFHAFEVSASRKIGFVMLDKTFLSCICLEVVSEQTGEAPIKISTNAMAALRSKFPAYFRSSSQIALGHAVVYPDSTETKYEADKIPDHLKKISSIAGGLPKFILCTGGSSLITCDALDPSELGKTLEEYARDGLCQWDKLVTEGDWDNGKLEWERLKADFEFHHSKGATTMKTPTIFSNNLDTLNRELLRLTIEQYTSLDRTENNPRCVIAGAAGTGKTILAMELAKRRAEKHRETVALMCSNAILSGRFKKWATEISKDVEGKIVAGTPATLLLSVFEDNDDLKNKYKEILKPPPSNNSEEIPSNNLEETLRLGAIDNGWYHFIRDAVDDLRKNELSNYFDYLIVDEVQNLLAPVFLNLMKELLKGDLDNGRWTLFGDPYQDIVTPDKKLEWEKVLVDFGIDHKWSYDELKANCRNTHQIAYAVSGLSRVESSPLSGVHGPDVQIEYFKGQKQLEDKLDNLITVSKSKGLESSQIILLSNTVGTKFGTEQANYGGLELRNIREVPEVDIRNISKAGESSDILRHSNVPPDILRYSDVYDFQGLESDLVILVVYRTGNQVSFEGTVLIENERYLNRVLYIGMSRAKTMLIVLADEGWKETINERIETWEMEQNYSQNVV